MHTVQFESSSKAQTHIQKYTVDSSQLGHSGSRALCAN